MHWSLSEAMGDEYPQQVEPSTSCSWWLLGRLVAALRPRLDGLLVDLVCEPRAELSERATDNFVREATHFRQRRGELPPTVLLVLRRPVGADRSASLEQHQ
jgi:hypothetical protein